LKCEICGRQIEIERKLDDLIVCEFCYDKAHWFDYSPEQESIDREE